MEGDPEVSKMVESMVESKAQKSAYNEIESL